ncbi:invasin [Klebsiella pneumoniae]|uniref:Invasin n=1 Tax=Klebsiella pneumoniae TaxID=573 RepID=A0A378A8P4_KLEPN|nr:invasin [Klebsiella pneumoniae]
MAAGYDVTGPGGGCRSTSTSTPASASNSISAIASNLFPLRTGYHNPVAVSVGLNYTPVPLVTVTAKHKQGENGVSPEQCGPEAKLPLWRTP